jgi:signal transduction histidine kinase
LKDLISESMAFVMEEARAKGITLHTAIDDLPQIQGDRGMLLSAFTNLLQNAIKFTPPGGTVAIALRAVAPRRAEVQFADECGGLPEGMPERLFAPFVQAGGDRSGLGLGLALTRQVVEAHRGGISVKDLPGRGCVFTVQLPLAPIAEVDAS